MRIRYPGWKEFGSGIRYGKGDPGSGRNIHPGSATLVVDNLCISLCLPLQNDLTSLTAEHVGVGPR
jgi:hypothetical protein